MKKSLLLIILSLANVLTAQDTLCRDRTISHTIHSEYLDEDRDYWVSLPLRYSDSLQYPVIYVFDAEWRFDLIKNLAFDLGANGKIENSIVVGIPHIDWKKKRGQDLTFSQSRIEYDGEAVDASWYTDANSGQGMKFYRYLIRELIPDVTKNYATNQHDTLIGHSYGGYFGAYLLSLDHPFEVIHMYDPSIWFSDGEVITRLGERYSDKHIKIHLTYQPVPEFHKNKIEEFIRALESKKNIRLTKALYPNDTHNSLFLDSFYSGIIQTNQ